MSSVLPAYRGCITNYRTSCMCHCIAHYRPLLFQVRKPRHSSSSALTTTLQPRLDRDRITQPDQERAPRSSVGNRSLIGPRLCPRSIDDAPPRRPIRISISCGCARAPWTYILYYFQPRRRGEACARSAAAARYNLRRRLSATLESVPSWLSQRGSRLEEETHRRDSPSASLAVFQRDVSRRVASRFDELRVARVGRELTRKPDLAEGARPNGDPGPGLVPAAQPSPLRSHERALVRRRSSPALVRLRHSVSSAYPLRVPCRFLRPINRARRSSLAIGLLPGRPPASAAATSRTRPRGKRGVKCRGDRQGVMIPVNGNIRRLQVVSTCIRIRLRATFPRPSRRGDSQSMEDRRDC